MPRTSLFVLIGAPALLAFAALQSNQDPQHPSSPTPTAGNSAQQQQQSPAQDSNPQSKASTNQRIHDSISDLLSSDPVLSGTDVEVAVDDSNITLTGHVETYAQHQRVLQLVSSYGQWRKIVDKVQMK